MKTLIIYHDADFDGILSNEVCRHFLNQDSNEVKSVGWDHGKPVPSVEGYDQIFMVDLSIDALMDIGTIKVGQPSLSPPTFIWIDHHKIAMQKFPPTIPGYRIDGVAACRLCWQWFTNDKVSGLPTLEDYVERKVTEPLLIRLAGEHDIFDHRDERALILQSGLRELEPIEMEDLIDEQFNDEGNEILDFCLGIGERAKKSRDRACAATITKIGHDVLWNGILFLCCNGLSGSQAFAAGIKPHHHALMAWRYDGQTKKCTVSMYHAPGHEDIDLSVFAKQNGGGGHKGACGFQTTLDNFIFIIEDDNVLSPV